MIIVIHFDNNFIGIFKASTTQEQVQLLTASSFSSPPPQFWKKFRKLLIRQLIITKIGLFQLYNNAKKLCNNLEKLKILTVVGWTFYLFKVKYFGRKYMVSTIWT